MKLIFVLSLVVTVCTTLVMSQSSCVDVQAPNPPSQFASKCWGFIKYKVQTASSYTNGGPLTCTREMESSLALVDVVAPLITSDCHAALLAYHCRIIFPPCNYTQAGTLQQIQYQLVPAQPLCDLISAKCSALELATVNSTYSAAGKKLPPNILYNGFDPACVPPSLHTIPSEINPNATARKPLCESYTGSVCAGLVSDPIFVPEYAAMPTATGGFATSQAYLEANVKAAAFTFNLAPVQKGCRDNYVRLLCSSAFSKCVSGPGPFAPYKFPAFPSRSFCESVQTNCPTTISQSTVAKTLGFANCSSLTGRSNIINTGGCQAAESGLFDRFPVSAYTLDLGAVKIPIAANSDPSTFSTAQVANKVQCPAPLVFNPDAGVEPFPGFGPISCAAPCPSLLYTQDQYDKADVIMVVLSTSGMILCAVLIVTYAAFKKTRKRVYTLYFTADIFFASVVLFFAVAVERPDVPGIYAKMRCDDNATGSRSGYCLFQAIVFLFTGSSACAWWCIQAVDLYLQVAHNARRWDKSRLFKKELVYNIWGWFYPFVATITAVAAEDLGNAVQGISWCLFLGNDLGWAIFYAPIGLEMIIGMFCMVFVTKQLWVSSAALGAHKKKGWWKLYIKPLIFVATFEIVWVIVFAFRSYGQNKEQQFQDAGKEYVNCLLVTKPTLEATGGTFDCEALRPQPDVALWYLITFFVAGIGVWTFLLYYSRENFVMWYHLCTCKPYNFSRTSGTGSTSREGSRTGSRTASSRTGSRRILKSKKTTDTRSTSEQDLTSNLKYGGSSTSLPPASDPLPTNIELSYENKNGNGATAIPEPEEADLDEPSMRDDQM